MEDGVMKTRYQEQNSHQTKPFQIKRKKKTKTNAVKQ